LHYLDAPLEEIVERAERRNASGEWTASPMTRAHFEKWATIFQPPDEEEMLLFDKPVAEVDLVESPCETNASPTDRWFGAANRTSLSDTGSEQAVSRSWLRWRRLSGEKYCPARTSIFTSVLSPTRCHQKL
jgi:hypothetical protein